MADIFLSYNQQDRDTVRRLAETLKAVGWSVWWDGHIRAGDTWRQLLDRELAAMRCMVVVWSSNSVKSEWVWEEATEGRLKGCLMPVSIEAVRPPAGFREIQAANLVGWDGTATFIGMRTLIEDIQQKIGAPVVTKPEQPPPIRVEPPARPVRRPPQPPIPRPAPPTRPPVAAPTPSTRSIANYVPPIVAVLVLFAFVASYFGSSGSRVEKSTSGVSAIDKAGQSVPLPTLSGESNNSGALAGAASEPTAPPSASPQPAAEVTAAESTTRQKEIPKAAFQQAPNPWLTREKCDWIRFQLSLGNPLSPEEKSLRAQCK